MKTKEKEMKKFLMILCSMILLSCTIFTTGCADNEKEKGDVQTSLTNGIYRVTEHSINNVEKTNVIGQTVTFDNGIIVDWNGNVAMYETKNNKIIVTNGQELYMQKVEGTFTSTSISFTDSLSGQDYLLKMELLMKYVGQPTLKIGNYKVITYLEDNVDVEIPGNSSIVMTVGNEKMNSFLLGLISYSVNGNNIQGSIKSNSGTTNISGSITTDSSFSIEYDINGKHTRLVLVYVDNVPLALGAYRVDSYKIDSVEQAGYDDKNAILTEKNFICWDSTTMSYFIAGDSIIVAWEESGVFMGMFGSITENTIELVRQLNHQVHIIRLVHVS